jgi:hypothetical protein
MFLRKGITMNYDVFISHASEDKAEIAIPLANHLKIFGLKVWLDEFELTIGDSLRKSIDQGLIQSRFGIVILSPNFFKKEWPKRELAGLIAKDNGKEKVLLPVWHNVTHEDVVEFSPILADKLAVSTDRGIEYVATQILQAVQRSTSAIHGDQQSPRDRISQQLAEDRKEMLVSKFIGQLKKGVDKWQVKRGAVVALTIGFVLVLMGSWAYLPDLGFIRQIGHKAEQVTVWVRADEYWYDTGITVQPGDGLELNATGSWWNGPHRTGPNGDTRPSCRKCLVPGANYGELVGRFTAAMDYGTSGMREAGTRLTTDSSPFRVGISTTFVADWYGNLMLAMNEETYSCKDGRIERCYEDNYGELEVKVTVWHSK